MVIVLDLVRIVNIILHLIEFGILEFVKVMTQSTQVMHISIINPDLYLLNLLPRLEGVMFAPFFV